MNLLKPALAAVAAVLGLACIVVLAFPTAVPGKSAAEQADDRDVAVRSAATRVTKAFLDVDYKDMEDRIEKVLDLSTGTFKNQYETAEVDLKLAVEKEQTVATAAVKHVGIADIDDDNAVVYVAADTKLSNASTKKAQSEGQDVDDRRIYRFQLNLTRVGDRWLLNDLQFIT